MWRSMTRAAIAVPLGLLGMLIYLGVVVAIGDRLASAHWLAQAGYFAVAGIVWAFPARRLILWAGRPR